MVFVCCFKLNFYVFIEDTTVDIMHVISKVFCSSETIQVESSPWSVEASAEVARAIARIQRPGLQYIGCYWHHIRDCWHFYMKHLLRKNVIARANDLILKLVTKMSLPTGLAVWFPVGERAIARLSGSRRAIFSKHCHITSSPWCVKACVEACVSAPLKLPGLTKSRKLNVITLWEWKLYIANFYIWQLSLRTKYLTINKLTFYLKNKERLQMEKPKFCLSAMLIIAASIGQ